MSFRYQYECEIIKEGTTYNSDGDPVVSTESITFQCDYQPTQKEVYVDNTGMTIPISFKLYVSPKDKSSVFDFTFDKTFGYTLQLGQKGSVEGRTGKIVCVFRTRLNTEVWVQ